MLHTGLRAVWRAAHPHPELVGAVFRQPLAELLERQPQFPGKDAEYSG